MGFFKKTVLLSNQGSYSKGMAILTIEKSKSGIFGCIKIFDIPITKDLILGITIDSKPIYKQTISFQNEKMYNFKLPNDTDIDGKVGCVLASSVKGNIEAVVWGSNGHISDYKSDVIDFLNKERKTQVLNNQEIENDIKKDVVHEKGTKENTTELKPELFESSEEEIEQVVEQEMIESNNFFNLIGEQIDELFNKFPEDEQLNNLIPNSRWVRVNYDNDSKTYIFGLIFQGDNVKYICYGVPSSFDVAPPPELQPYSQWLKLNDNDGFWVSYQDAETGDSIIIDDVYNL